MTRRLLNLLTLLSLLLAACTAGRQAGRAVAPVPAPAPSPQERASALAALVHNGDVTWTWDAYSSVHPLLDTPAAAALRSLGRAAVPPLLLALDDPARYVAAHVLLTEIAGPPYSVDAERYNDLRVDLDADECVEIRPDAAPALLRKWLDWARAEGVAPPDVTR